MSPPLPDHLADPTRMGVMAPAPEAKAPRKRRAAKAEAAGEDPFGLPTPPAAAEPQAAAAAEKTEAADTAKIEAAAKASTKEHARCGPSSAERWLACPASIMLAEKAPPEPFNAAADFGTRAHAVAEAALTAVPYILPEFQEVVLPWVQAVLAVTKPDGFAPGGTLLVETKETICDDIWGTADASVVDPFDCKIWVGDLKTGTAPVSPEKNVQLGLYAVAILIRVAGSNPDKWADWTVVLCITQARRSDGGDAVQTWVAPIDWLEDLCYAAEAAAKRSHDPAEKPVPGDHCTYCKAETICPARQAELAAVFPQEVIPANLSAEATLAKVLELGPRVIKLIKACQAVALKNPPPGWKVVEGRLGHRAWADEAAPVKFAEQAGPEVKAYKVVPKTPPELEKEIGKKAFGQALDAALKKAPGATLITRAKGKPALAPLADKRPAIAADALLFPAADEDDESPD